MKIEISSKSNENIKFLKKLFFSSKFRNNNKKFVIEGVRLCKEVLESGVSVDKIFYTENCYEKFKDIIDEIISENNPSEYVINESILEAVCDTQSPQGIICVCNYIDKQVNLDKIDKYSNIILLENLQNPSNLGSIFRSLNAFGTDLVAVSHDTCDIYNPKVIRGSMGAVFKLNVVKISNLKEFIFDLKNCGFKVFAAMPDKDSKCVTLLNKISKKAVILGNEGNGVKDETLNLCDEKVTIPMNEKCESLSVAVAAGIISWEMVRKES